MNNANVFEFQSKGNTAPEFTTPTGKEIMFFADGQRLIAKLLNE